MEELAHKKIAAIASDGFEEKELTEPMEFLRKNGAFVHIIAPHDGMIQAFNHHDKSIQVATDYTLDEVKKEDYDGLLLPGGALNADSIRLDPKLHEVIRYFMDTKKPIAVICHAPWELISAGVAKGHTLTSFYTIQDDIRNAGAQWVDKEVVVDENIVTSRQPADIPAFNKAFAELFKIT